MYYDLLTTTKSPENLERIIKLIKEARRYPKGQQVGPMRQTPRTPQNKEVCKGCGSKFTRACELSATHLQEGYCSYACFRFKGRND